MKKIVGIIISGVIIWIIAVYYFPGIKDWSIFRIINRLKVSENKKLTPSEYITDVIKLKSGNIIMGKILKETSDSVLIRTADGTMEVTTLKRQIASMRKATADDIKAAQDEIVRAAKAAEQALIFEKERAVRLKEYYETRNAKEIAVASKVSSQSSPADFTDAKNRGQVVSGMSEDDVCEVLGQPDDKIRDDRRAAKGKGERVKWSYCTGIVKREVNFYNGRVE